MRIDVLSPRVLPYAVTLGFLGAGALVGLVVDTGSLVMISLVIGGVAGLLLLNALPVAVWLILIGVLLVSGPVAYFFPALAKSSWLFSLLGIFMAGAALLYGAVGKEKPERAMPAFVMFALAFAAVAGVGAFFSDGSLAEISAGAKRQFQFWGVLFLLAVVPFSSAAVKRWIVFLLGVAVAQLPFALYQRVVLVPQVMGYERPGFVPFDIVVGSFEGSMFGGGASAIMALFQVLAAIALFCAWREKLIGGLRCLLLLLPVVAPLALGETKVVMFLIPVVLLGSFYDTIAKRPLAFIGGALATLLLGGVLAYVYFAVQVSGDVTVSENLADTFAYNFGERGYYGTGVNRLTAVPYWFQSQTWAEPVRTLFGYGVGSAYGMDGRVPLPGHLFVAHAGMHIDLVAASQILWETGIVGALLFYGMLLGAIQSATRSLAEARSAWDRLLCRILLGGLAASVLMTFYSSSVIVLVTHSFLFAFTMGLVAWRSRLGPLALDAQDLQRERVASAEPARGAMKGRKFRHWEPAAAPGFAGGLGAMAAAAPGAGTAAPDFRPGSLRGASGADTGFSPLRSGRSGPRQTGHGPAAPWPSMPDPTRRADRFAQAPRPAARPTPDSTADFGAVPMFAVDDDAADAPPGGAGLRSRRRDGSRPRGRIEPVIDIDVSEDDPRR